MGAYRSVVECRADMKLLLHQDSSGYTFLYSALAIVQLHVIKCATGTYESLQRCMAYEVACTTTVRFAGDNTDNTLRYQFSLWNSQTGQSFGLWTFTKAKSVLDPQSARFGKSFCELRYVLSEISIAKRP